MRRLPLPGPLLRLLPKDRTWAVGGFLRDALLQRPARDLDFAVREDPEVLSKKIAAHFCGKCFTLDEHTRTFRTVFSIRKKFYQVDLSPLQGKTIEEDLRRRDFTINALAVSLQAPQSLLDPLGGLTDLRRKRIRMVSAGAFVTDPLRLLRAFRLAAELRFAIDPNTLKAIRVKKSGIRSAAGERIREEFSKLLQTTEATPWIRQMDRCRLLTRIFPELEPSRRCALHYYPKEGVLGHSLDTLERLELLLNHFHRIFPKLASALKTYCQSPLSGYPRSVLLKYAALLHDVAKPAAAQWREGRLRFFEHDVLGSRMAEKIASRLRMSSPEKAAIASIVRHHLRPGNLATNQTITDKAIYRFFRDVGPEGVGLLLVCWADYASYVQASVARLARSRTASPKTDRHLSIVRELLRRYFQESPKIHPPKILDGNDVMRIRGLAPGPRVGQILEIVRERQASGKILSRAQALEFLKAKKSKPLPARS